MKHSAYVEGMPQPRSMFRQPIQRAPGARPIWLPAPSSPTIVPIDNRNGPTLAVPYYWNIAPNQDMTLTPSLSTRRGMGADVEYRYLTPEYRGTLHVAGLPHDQVAGEARGMVDYQHQGVVAAIDQQGSRESLEDLLDRIGVPPVLLVLDGVTDPRNLGACLRVADAAGVHELDEDAPARTVHGVGYIFEP